MYDILGCSFLALLLYWNTLDADFAYDDFRAILKNQDILQTTPLSNIFYNDFWGTPLIHSGSHKSYRPLCVLSYRLNNLLGELEPYGYHLGNVLLHVAVTALFTYTARAVLLRRTLPSCLAGLLFAAHPIHTEAVAGIVGRADIGACLFFLLSFLVYVRYCQTREAHLADWTGRTRARALWECTLLALSVLLATLSMLTKEQGMMVLAVNATYDIFIQNKMRLRDFLSLRFISKDFGRLREGVLSQLVSMVVLVGLRLHFMGNTPPQFAPSDNPAASEGSLQTRLLTFLYLPALNAWLLLCPYRLSFDWSMGAVPLVQSLADIRNLSTLAFYSGLATFAWYCFRELDDLHHHHDEEEEEEQHHPTPSHHSNGHCKSNGYSNGYKALPNGHKASPNGHAKNGFAKNGFTHYTNGISNGNGIRYDTQAHLHKRLVSQKKGPHLAVGKTSAAMPPPSTQERTRILNAVIASFALLVLPFLPATNLAFYVGFVVAERILYIPSMGFCLLTGEAIHQLWRRSQKRKRAAVMATTLALLVLFGARTFLRNLDWHSEEDLYRSGIDVNPPKAWGNLANILKVQGKTAEAEEAYRNALSYRGNMADVHYNLGILLQESKRLEEAVTSYQLAIQCRPRLANAHLNLGIVLNMLGRRAEAEAVYRHAATLDDTGLKDPKNQMTGIISSLFNLGRLLQDQGRNEEALKVFMEGIGRRPDHYPPQSLYNMLGETYFQLGRLEDAERWYKKSLGVKPDHVPAHLTYAHMLSKMGMSGDAEALLKKAMDLDPANYNVYQHYGQFLNDQGRTNEALTMFQRAYDLQADEHEVTFNLANALRQVGKNEEAEGFYKKAAALKPLVATSHMNLGAIYHLNGKLEKAETSYTEALRLQPDDPTTLQNLRKLRSLRAKRVRASQAKNTED